MFKKECFGFKLVESGKEANVFVASVFSTMIGRGHHIESESFLQRKVFDWTLNLYFLFPNWLSALRTLPKFIVKLLPGNYSEVCVCAANSGVNS